MATDNACNLVTPINKPFTNKFDPFGADPHREKLVRLGDPLTDIETGAASEHDTRHFKAVMNRANTSQDVYADRAKASLDCQIPVTRVSVSTCTTLSSSSCDRFHPYTALIRDAL